MKDEEALTLHLPLLQLLLTYLIPHCNIPIISLFKRDMNRLKGKERWIHCYKSSQKILLVGEGDFSFSACLARAFNTAQNIVATSYLQRELLQHYHWTSIPHLEELERLGCLLLYKVDVYNMHTHPTLNNMKFDVIIFNFPHAGHYYHLHERDLQLIQMHVDLVQAYFRSASKMLSKGGEVHLRHRADPPYDTWNVVSLAREAGLSLKEMVQFEKRDYPGYHNKRGGGINTNKSFPIVCAYTYKFALDLPKVVADKVQEVSNEKDACYGHVNVPLIKDEDEVDEVQPQNNVPKNGCVVVDELNLHVPEMVNHKIDDDLLKKDDLVHVDLDLLEVIDDGCILNKDEANVDLDLPRLGVHEHSKKNDIEVEQDLLDVCVEEVKDECENERVHGELYVDVLEKMGHLYMQQTDSDAAEMKDDVHDGNSIEERKCGVDGYGNNQQSN